MNAVETIETLIKLGTLVGSAASDARAKDEDFDWSQFIQSEAFQSISAAVKKLLDSLKQSDIDQTIERLGTKQAALLGAGKLEDLPVDKLIQFAQLSDAKVVLRAKKVALTATPPFLTWLVDDALPVLIKAAPAVLPIIL